MMVMWSRPHFTSSRTSGEGFRFIIDFGYIRIKVYSMDLIRRIYGIQFRSPLLSRRSRGCRESPTGGCLVKRVGSKEF